jgi:predicted  nucleic acid-binding Zn-ribbon protein
LSDDHLRNDVGATNQYVSRTSEGFVEMHSKIKQIQQDISLLEKRAQSLQNATSSGVAKTAVTQSDIQHINNTTEKAIEQIPKKLSEEAGRTGACDFPLTVRRQRSKVPGPPAPPMRHQ